MQLAHLEHAPAIAGQVLMKGDEYAELPALLELLSIGGGEVSVLGADRERGSG